MGGAISYLGYMMLASLLAIWMAVIIARSSGFLWGLVCFVCWPAATPHLFRHWGDEGNDIRIPFLAIVASVAMMFWSANKATEQAIDQGFLHAGYTEAEIEELRETDPELAAMLDESRANAEAGASPVAFEFVDDGSVTTRMSVSFGPPADAPGRRGAVGRMIQGDTPTSAASGAASAVAEGDSGLPPISAPGVEISVRTKAIQLAERGLPAQRGRIALGEAGTLDLPADYVFVEARHLKQLSDIGVGRRDAHTLGWVIHRERRFSDEDGWHVELRWIPGEHAAPGDGEAWRSGLAGIDGVEESEPTLMPGWNAETGIATFFDRDPRVGVEWQRAHALKAVTGGVIQATVAGLEPGERELGLRAARFLASRVTAPAAASPGGKPLLELARREAGAEPLPASG